MTMPTPTQATEFISELMLAPFANVFIPDYACIGYCAGPLPYWTEVARQNIAASQKYQ